MNLDRKLPSLWSSRDSQAIDPFLLKEPLPFPGFQKQQEIELRSKVRDVEKWKLFSKFPQRQFMPFEKPQPKNSNSELNLLIKQSYVTPSIHSTSLNSMFRPRATKIQLKNSRFSIIQDLNKAIKSPSDKLPSCQVAAPVGLILKSIKKDPETSFQLTDGQTALLHTRYNEELFRQIVKKNISRNKENSPNRMIKQAKQVSSKITENFSELSNVIRPRVINYNKLIEDLIIEDQHRFEKTVAHEDLPRKKNLVQENSELESELKQTREKIVESKSDIASLNRQIELFSIQLIKLNESRRAAHQAYSLDQQSLAKLSSMTNLVSQEHAREYLANLIKEKQEINEKKVDAESILKQIEINLQNLIWKKKVIKIKIVDNLIEMLRQFDLTESTNQIKKLENLRHPLGAEKKILPGHERRLRFSVPCFFGEFLAQSWLISSTPAKP